MKYVIMRILLFVCILALVVFLASCNLFPVSNQIHNGDWEYDLPHDYTIWHVNSQKIVLGHYNSANSISFVLEDNILTFCYNDEYVCVETENDDSTLINPNESSTSSYYIINMVDNSVLGPFSKENFEKNCVVDGIDKLSDWISTNHAPGGATFGR